MRLRFSRRAYRDLIAIGEWIRRDDPERAATFVEELETACRDLLDFPQAFPIAFSRGGRLLRKRVHGDYPILYEVFADRLVVAAIIHGARDLDAALN